MKSAAKAHTMAKEQEDQMFPDPVALSKILMDVAERASPIIQDMLAKNNFDSSDFVMDPMNFREAYVDFMNHLWDNPRKLAEMQIEFVNDWMHLWQESAKKFMGEDGATLYSPRKDDRRFKSPLWEQSPAFDFIKQSYLLTSHWIEKVVGQTEGLDDETRSKINFMTKQYLSAVSPTNFLFTNPEVLEETLNTKGENLIRGLENLLEDIERGHGHLKISTTDYNAFELGRNIATTPGKVVYQNDLMQLIQYEATTDKVYKRPLLIIPPWINKFYILDLQSENSFIKWLTEQGHTVFVVSWVNPNKELSKKRFEDYMEEGVFDAITQIQKATGEPDVNVIAYCLGGTLTSVTLGWLAAKKKDDLIASTTFLTTLIDFEKAGDMKLFMDDAQISMLDKQMAERGFLDANHMRQTFSLLRANDMIWSFVVNNYLMGKEPFPFDLLYWNDDATNMPAAMHSFYLRKCYRDNLLVKKGGVTMNGVDIDMTKVKTPCFFLSTMEDHIAPWKATYAATQLFSGETTFTLAASGHVAGVVNPPAKKKYCYWTNKNNVADPDEWFSNAKSHDGSWWPQWQKWIGKYAGEKVPARKIGGGKLKPIEDAPGSYVKMKAD